jgi:hypothetical protein
VAEHERVELGFQIVGLGHARRDEMRSAS